MRIIPYIIIIILFLGFTNNLKSQNIVLKRTIKWQKNIDKTQNQEKSETNKAKIYQFFGFENADFGTRDDNFPVYYELIALGSENYSMQLTDMQFEVFSDFENKQFGNNKIPADIKVEYKILHQRKKPYLSLNVFPFKKNLLNGKNYKLTSFNVVLIKNKYKNPTQKDKFYTTNSVLNTGTWVKIKLKESGIYKISFDKLQSIGISNPENVRIFGNGGSMLPINNSDKQPDDLSEIDIEVKAINNSDKQPDDLSEIDIEVKVKDNYILFYGDGVVQWKYDETNELFKHELNLYSD
ncbi:MAG: hypothetical protein B6I20_06215, partial [Bacteroidetes bacterium 4572_117]